MSNLAHGIHRIEVRGDWGLHDFLSFGPRYLQMYGFLYALNFEITSPRPDPRVLRAFNEYKWTGWSSYNFFENLRKSVPSELRPRVKAISVSSPGYIELTVAAAVASAVAAIIVAGARGVRELSKTVAEIDGTRHQILVNQKERLILDEKLKHLRLATEAKELALLEKRSEHMISILGLDKAAFWKAVQDPRQRHKILAAVSRRVRDLAKLQEAFSTESQTHRPTKAPDGQGLDFSRVIELPDEPPDSFNE